MLSRKSQNLFTAIRRARSEQLQAHVREHEAATRQIQRQTNEAWEDVNRGWENLDARLVETGLLQLQSGEEDIVCLNVGGVLLSVRRSVLAGGAFGHVLDVRWKDGRFPRDTEGFILLDESPVCVKHLVRVAVESAGAERARLALPADETPRLTYVSHALGLVPRDNPSHPEGRAVGHLSTGNGAVSSVKSAILSQAELCQLTTTIKVEGWNPLELCGLELIYRGSRDGMDAEAFHSRCGDDSPSTFTLVKHRKYMFRGSLRMDVYGIIGGYSSASWAVRSQGTVLPVPSAGAFIFELRKADSPGTRLTPVKYNLREGHTDWAIYCGSHLGPSFGADDLFVTLNGSAGGVVSTGSQSYEVPAGSSFLGATTREVAELEVFRVHHHTGGQVLTLAPPADSSAGVTGATLRNAANMSEEEAEYTRKFGASIAKSRMEERAELENARAELTRAEEKASAALAALEAVYGPDIASGKPDDVVELSVRGTRMTTLRSTLTACADSALATWFNGNWPPTDKDLDEHGRRIVDCDPAVFSKVLDVLRMKKRAAWGVPRGGGGAAESVPVVVREADRACFEEFVDKYFPGCEGFIMDLVEPSKQANADGLNS